MFTRHALVVKTLLFVITCAAFAGCDGDEPAPGPITPTTPPPAAPTPPPPAPTTPPKAAADGPAFVVPVPRQA